jgi:cell division protein ZipA
MDDGVFRWILAVLGSCIIIAVLIHGIWVSRKNSQKNTDQSAAKRASRKPQLQPSGWQNDDWQGEKSSKSRSEFTTDDDDGLDLKINFEQDEDDFETVKKTPQMGEFDDLGLGVVRVVGTNPHASPILKVSKDSVDDIPSLDDFEPSNKVSAPETKPVSSGKVYASVVSQPKPEYVAKYGNTGIAKNLSSGNAGKTLDEYQAPEPPPFLLKKDESEINEKSSVDMGALLKTAQDAATTEEPLPIKPELKVNTIPSPEKVSLAEQARQLVMGKKSEGVNKKRREPKIADDQMRIDFEEETVKEPLQKSPATKAKPTDVAQEVLVLNVKAGEGNPIQGAALLPMLLTLGFKFGDQDIFHRHVNASGKGPVLFSLANMFKPGNFDIDNLENFTTLGISLFMILPIEGDPHQVFNMMHNAARKIADEFSAQVYDGRRTLLTKQSLQQYVEKIREFERKRMVNRQ